MAKPHPVRLFDPNLPAVWPGRVAAAIDRAFLHGDQIWWLPPTGSHRCHTAPPFSMSRACRRRCVRCGDAGRGRGPASWPPTGSATQQRWTCNAGYQTRELNVGTSQVSTPRSRRRCWGLAREPIRADASWRGGKHKEGRAHLHPKDQGVLGRCTQHHTATRIHELVSLTKVRQPRETSVSDGRLSRRHAILHPESRRRPNLQTAFGPLADHRPAGPNPGMAKVTIERLMKSSRRRPHWWRPTMARGSET